MTRESVNERSKMRIAQKIVDNDKPSYLVKSADGYYRVYDNNVKLLDPQNIKAGQTICVVGDIEGLTVDSNPKELVFSVRDIQRSEGGSDYVIVTDKGFVTSVDVRSHIRSLNDHEIAMERC